jgi:hypothetical protein
MPSCSTSSNISSAINALSVVQGGSRLMVAISATSNPGLTIGNVIRYDVINSGYTASKANDPANSEVFGVVESYDSSSTSYNVVMYGSISLGSSYLASIAGSTGACGGNDIYFLSGTTAGLLQNLAPSDLEHIVKPVYQAAPHGSYSGVVINYLGYRIGGDIEASSIDTELGNMQIVIGNNTFTDGYVDASINHILPIADYSEFYSKYGTQFGFNEVVTTNDIISGSVQSGQIVTQDGTPPYTGTITSVDYTNKKIYIKRSPGSSLASTNKKIKITTPTFIEYNITSSAVYGTYSPVVEFDTAIINTLDNNGLNVNQSTIGIGIKVKPQGVKVNIPSSATVTNLTATTITLGTGASDVESILNDYETRISAIENYLGF